MFSVREIEGWEKCIDGMVNADETDAGCERE